MRKFLQLTFFILLFSCSKIFAQTACFTFSEFPVGASHCAGITLIFDGSCSTGATSYDWNFGPNAIPSTSTNQFPGLVQFPVCDVSNQVTLTINGGVGAGTVYTQIIPIYCNPTSCFTVNPAAACFGTPFNFNSSCSQVGTGASSLSYQWDLCDGSGPTTANPTHVYGDTGCFCAKLIVTNNFGCSDFFQENAAVCITSPPAFTISGAPTTTCLSTLTVTFQSTLATGGSGGYTYTWSFPGGNPSSGTGQFPPAVTYGTGSYSVTCTVSDNSGCSTTITLLNYINVGNNSTSIILSNDTVCVGECVSVSTAAAFSYSWTITNGACVTPNTAQTTAGVNYCFTCPGTFNVSLTSVVSGCTVSATNTIHVFDKPVACINITSNPPSCSFPQTVNVTYCGPPPVAGYQYLWSFPGGTPSSYVGANPPNAGAIVYNSCGQFTISLQVIGQAGCDSSITLTDTVKIDCPQACYSILDLPVNGHFCAPLTMDYDAGCSTGAPTIYKWCVNEQGTPPCVPTSQGPTPTLSFPTLGCYDVTLITINAAGCTDTVTNFFPGGPICVGVIDTACFTADPLEQCAPLPVNFTNCTTDTLGNSPGSAFYPCTQWCWNFGDGGGCQSTVQDPQHVYQDTGLFDIMLVVNNCGCSDTLIYYEYIHIVPPIPLLAYDINCDSPNVVMFTSSGSLGADSIFWSFPGGNPSSATQDTLIYVTYPYPNPNAQHTAQLKICSDASGCCDSVSVSFFLRDLQALVNIDTQVCYPQTSWVVDSSIGASTYTWKIFDLCNGNVQLTGLNSNARAYNNASNYGAITWPQPGRYHVWLKIGAINGCLDTVEFDVTVRGVIPGFYGIPLAGCAPITTTFQDTSNANCVSFPVSYSITWGDLPVSSSPFVPVNQTVTHTYTTNGSFNVTETVIDQYGCQTTLTTPAYVVTQTPTLSFYAPDTTICLGTPVCFTNLSTGTNLSYIWYFGDGDTSHIANPCHTYTASGFYTDTLTATDQFGCTSILIKTNYIFVGSVDVDFYVNDSSVSCPVLQDTFFVSPDVANGCGKYYWSFGDGTYSTIKQPFHIYGYAGTFTVSLIVTDTCLGCSDTIIKVDYIFLGGPFSNPTATPDTGCAPELVYFDLTPTNSVSFLWDFDDNSALVNGNSSITHLYTTEGVYYPSVVLTDSSFTCTYTRIVDTVVICDPHALFISSTNDLCSNGSVTFIDSSTSMCDVVQYNWNFGDLSNSNLQNPPPHVYNTFGEYIVTLTITTLGGCTSSFSDTIHVTTAPVAFPIVPLNGCVGIATQFNCDTVTNAVICFEHWDFGDTNATNDTSNICNPVYLYPGVGVYTVTLIVFGCNGCNDTATSIVTIDPPPVANAGPDVTICFEDTTLLIGSGGTPQWIDSLPPSLSNLNIDSTLAFPFSTITYTFIVTDPGGCKDTDNVTVTITQPPVAVISAGDTICPGDSYTFTASGGTTYLWNTGETTAFITVTPDSTTTYFVTASVGTCSDDTFAIVVVYPLPPADAGDTAEICFGDTTQLNGSGGLSFSWSPGNTLSDSTIFNPLASPTITTEYILTITDSNGCKNKDSVLIIVHPLPVIDAGINKKICSGTCTQLNVTGAIYYSWTPTIGLLNDSIPNPICCPSDTSEYFVSGTDIYGCVGNDSIIVFVLFPFTVQYPNDTCFCIGESSKLCAVSTTQSTYQWKPPYGLDSTTVACATASPSVTTTYTIYVSDSIGCYADTGDVVICIYPLPSVVASPDVSILVGTDADLTAYNSSNPGTGTLLWSPDSTLSCYTCENPEATPLITTTYIVELTDLHGCKDEDTTVVKVYCNDNALFVPNAFTPNNDGKNDYFHLDGRGIAKLNYLRIFNRWGQLVFETSDFNAMWDGKVNGKKSEPEVFDYLLEAVCSTGETIRKQGNITLIR